MTVLITNSFRTKSPAANPAEAKGWLLLAILLAAGALFHFPPAEKAEAGPRPTGVSLVYQGRRFELPEEREGLIALLRAKGPGSVLFPAQATVEGEAVLSNPERWVWGLPLDINRATWAELERLPGISRRRAEKILLERARRGRFATMEEFLNLPEVSAEARPALAQGFRVEGSLERDADSARKN